MLLKNKFFVLSALLLASSVHMPCFAQEAAETENADVGEDTSIFDGEDGLDKMLDEYAAEQAASAQNDDDENPLAEKKSEKQIADEKQLARNKDEKPFFQSIAGAAGLGTELTTGTHASQASQLNARGSVVANFFPFGLNNRGTTELSVDAAVGSRAGALAMNKTQEGLRRLSVQVVTKSDASNNGYGVEYSESDNANGGRKLIHFTLSRDDIFGLIDRGIIDINTGFGENYNANVGGETAGITFKARKDIAKLFAIALQLDSNFTTGQERAMVYKPGASPDQESVLIQSGLKQKDTSKEIGARLAISRVFGDKFAAELYVDARITKARFIETGLAGSVLNDDLDAGSSGLTGGLNIDLFKGRKEAKKPMVVEAAEPASSVNED